MLDLVQQKLVQQGLNSNIKSNYPINKIRDIKRTLLLKIL